MVLEDLLKAIDDFHILRSNDVTMDAGTLYSLGLVLVLVGVLIMVVAALLIVLLRGRRDGESRGGGAVIIGPVPIVFGTDKESLKTVLLLAITLTTLLAILTVIMYFMSK